MFSPAVGAGCARTLPRSPDPGLEKRRRHPQPNSTSNSRLTVQATRAAQAICSAAPHAFRFQLFQSSVPVYRPNEVVTKRKSLLEFVVLKKHPRIPILEEHQTHLVNSLIGMQKLLNRSRGDCRGLSLGITVDTRGNGGESDRENRVPARERE